MEKRKKLRTRHMPMKVEEGKKREYNRAKTKWEADKEIEEFTERELFLMNGSGVVIDTRNNEDDGDDFVNEVIIRLGK